MEPTVALLKILSWRAWEKSHENSMGVAGLWNRDTDTFSDKLLVCIYALLYVSIN
jgi:hypothetical protein